jgi:hypothetical protein
MPTSLLLLVGVVALAALEAVEGLVGLELEQDFQYPQGLRTQSQ